MNERFQREVNVIYADGTRLSGTIIAEEITDDGKSTGRIELEYERGTVRAESNEGFFDALCKVRIALEREGAILCCNGASEDVYPSPMQISMGPAILAYRTTIGRQALRKDIVNIFDSGEANKPSTVKQQRDFHKRWHESLARRK